MAVSQCIQFISIPISIASLVYISKIYTLTKVDKFDTKLENPEQYFNSSIETLSQMDKKCKCGEEVLNNYCTEKQILSGCFDISLNQSFDKPQNLRFLLEETKCKSFETQIKEGNKKLNEIFKLNISGIHSIVTGLIIIILLNLAVLFLISFVSCGAFCFGEKAYYLLVPCLPCILIISYGSGITNVVLYIILLVRYYGGDIRKYAEFLECSNVKRSQFNIEFKDIEELKFDFTVFISLHIIYIILNIITSTSNSKKNENK